MWELRNEPNISHMTSVVLRLPGNAPGRAKSFFCKHGGIVHKSNPKDRRVPTFIAPSFRVGLRIKGPWDH